MKFLKFINILFALTFCSSLAFGNNWDCDPSQAEIDDFFQGVQHWTEIEPGSNNINRTNPGELIINFSDIESTRIKRGSRTLETQMDSACMSSNGQELLLQGSAKTIIGWWNGSMHLYSTNEGVITGNMRIRLGSFPFIFRPNNTVIRN